MLITPAYAQAAAPGGSDLLLQLAPLFFIVAIFYVLFIRPQQKRVKAHQEMVRNLRRGDTVVTSGGLIGKVTKLVSDAEVEIELAEGIKVRAVRATIGEVRVKGEPVEAK